jgi:CDGSH-type Zn-finger protein/uncharacterized Fe-S cluster protein YjdI
MTARFVEGEKIDIGFDGHRCIHARHCVLGRSEVFEANTPGEWIHPDAVPADAIVSVVELCPSGALTYRRKAGGADEAPPPVNQVRLRENGPLAFHGELDIAGEAQLRATLCRCGASQRKPYCDRSHTKIGFAASGEPVSKESPALAVRSGPVKVTPQTNGCLRVEGNLEIVSGTGRRIEQTTKTFLCRCGHSQNKPFCDGSHKAAGFVA